jgi:hypothetical protein
MVTLSDFMDKTSQDGSGGPGKVRVEQTPWGFILPGRFRQGAVMPLLRAVAVFLGVSFVFGAVGLWVVPGSSYAADIILMKVLISMTCLYVGVVLIQVGEEVGKPEVHLDTLRREVRLVERARNGSGKLLGLHPFADLSGLELKGNRLIIHNREGELLASVELESEERSDVEDQLRNEVFGRR